MRTDTLALATAAAFAAVSPAIALAHSAPRCAAETIVGGYGIQTMGFSDFVPGPIPSRIGDFVPIASLGLNTFKSGGTTDGSETASVGGLVFPFTSSGTYAVNADCTGTWTRSLSIGGPAEVLQLVVLGGGAKIFVMGTLPGGRLFSGSMERLSARDN